MPICTNPNDRYTIRAIVGASDGADKFSIHDERDLLHPGKRIASCPDDSAAVKVWQSLNEQYTIAMKCGPILLRQRRTVKQ
jgi:hypothetical protein